MKFSEELSPFALRVVLVTDVKGMMELTYLTNWKEAMNGFVVEASVAAPIFPPFSYAPTCLQISCIFLYWDPLHYFFAKGTHSITLGSLFFTNC